MCLIPSFHSCRYLSPTHPLATIKIYSVLIELTSSSISYIFLNSVYFPLTSEFISFLRNLKFPLNNNTSQRQYHITIVTVMCAIRVEVTTEVVGSTELETATWLNKSHCLRNGG